MFINPSTSDVVATTTAEALAMGKFVVCADHPSNRFFSTFTNCLIYKTPEEFSKCVDTAMNTEPKPLSAEEQQRLSWENATERFLDATELSMGEKPHGVSALLDNTLWAAHNGLTGIEGAHCDFHLVLDIDNLHTMFSVATDLDSDIVYYHETLMK